MPSYGRGSVASSRTAQRGNTGGAYRSQSRSAQALLTGEEIQQYRDASTQLGKRPLMRKKSSLVGPRTVERHKAAIKKLQGLRSKAAGRALGEYEAAGIQHSKPWLQRAPEAGLIQSEGVSHSLENIKGFGGEGSRKGKGASARSRRRRELAGTHEFGSFGVERARSARSGEAY